MRVTAPRLPCALLALGCVFAVGDDAAMIKSGTELKGATMADPRSFMSRIASRGGPRSAGVGAGLDSDKESARKYLGGSTSVAEVARKRSELDAKLGAALGRRFPSDFGPEALRKANERVPQRGGRGIGRGLRRPPLPANRVQLALPLGFESFSPEQKAEFYRNRTLMKQELMAARRAGASAASAVGATAPAQLGDGAAKGEGTTPMGEQPQVEEDNGGEEPPGASSLMRRGAMAINITHIQSLLAEAKAACVAENAALCANKLLKPSEHLTLLDGSPLSPQAAGVSVGCLQRVAKKAGDGASQLGDGCAEALKLHRQALSMNPMLDEKLRKECADTVKTEQFKDYCQGIFPSAAARVFAPLQEMQCLRRLRSIGRLQEHCSMQVERVQQDEAHDMSLDSRLYGACEADVKKGPCAGVQTGEGKLRQCLEKEVVAQQQRLLLWVEEYNKAGGQTGAPKPPASLLTVSRECVKLLGESNLVRADSIKLHPGLEGACAADRQRLCSGVKPGGGAVLECLAAHEDDQGLAETCREKIVELKRRQTSDFRLDPQLSKVCTEDIMAHCKDVRVGGGKVLQCLLEHEDQLQAQDCRAKVTQYGRRATSDVQYNQPILKACVRYIVHGALCGRDTLGLPAARGGAAEIASSRGRVLGCLKENVTRLDGNCSVQVHKLVRTQARDIVYNPHIMRQCGHELKAPEYCGGVQHGQGRVIACLQEKRTEPGFTFACSKAVVQEFKHHAADVELMVALKQACASELKSECDYDERTLHGAAASLHNATAYREQVKPIAACIRGLEPSEIKSPACRQHVKVLQLAASENIDLNPEIHSACEQDQLVHCAGAGKGSGLQIACLESRALKNEPLAPLCSRALLRYQQNALMHVELNWPVASACAREMNNYCSAALQAQVGTLPIKKKVYAVSGDTAAQVKEREQPLQKVTVLGCLQANVRDPGFGAKCLAKVQAATRTQLSDMRADIDMHVACHAFAEKNCQEAWLAQVQSQPESESYRDPEYEPSRRMMGVVYECVSDWYSLHGTLGEEHLNCELELSRVQRLQVQFPTASASLTNACQGEFHRLCGSNASDDALDDRHLLRCIRKNDRHLSEKCLTKAKALERLAHRELAHNAEITTACHTELVTHCAEPISESGVIVMSGASTKADNDQMACLDRISRSRGRPISKQCGRVLTEYQIRAMESLDLMEQVRKPCAADYASLCESATSQSHAGAALQCLKDNRDELESEECHEKVLGVMARSAADARYDPLLRSLCDKEIAECKKDNVKPGEGRINDCLRGKLRAHALSSACKQQVFKGMVSELEDVRLNYPVQRDCRVELVHFCAQVPAGEARRLGCLEAHQAQADFGKACAKTLRRSLKDASNDFRLRPKLRTACIAAVGEYCKDVPPGDAAVIGCLLEHEQKGDLTSQCGFEVRGAARSAFVNFDWSHGITSVCDADIWGECAGEGGPRAGARGAATAVAQHSADTNNDGVFTGDEVWRCISDAAHNEATEFFSPQCKSLVLMLAPNRVDSPEDARAMAQELSKQHVALSAKHASLEKQHQAEVAKHASTDARKTQLESEIASLNAEMRSREADLSRLREQLMFQEEMERKARQLKEAYEAQRSSGIFLSWKLVLPMAALGLAASLYMASRINSPGSKGYTQVFQPKDH